MRVFWLVSGIIETLRFPIGRARNNKADNCTANWKDQENQKLFQSHDRKPFNTHLAP